MFAQCCAYDWPVTCKRRWRLLNSFLVGCLALLLGEDEENLENKYEKCTRDSGFPGERRVICQLIRELDSLRSCGAKRVFPYIWRRSNFPEKYQRPLYRANLWLSESFWSTSNSGSSSPSAMFLFLICHVDTLRSLTANHRRWIETCWKAMQVVASVVIRATKQNLLQNVELESTLPTRCLNL